MPHLGARRCDEEAHDLSGEPLVAGRQRAHRGLHVVAHDRRRAAQALQRREPQHPRPGLSLGLPEACHHELEVRWLNLRSTHGRGSRRHRVVAADELPQHLVRKPLLELHRLGGDGVPVPDRALDRLPSGVLAQPVEAEVIVEQVGDPALEAVEAGQGVVAQGDQEAHRHGAVRDEAGQLGVELVA